MPQTASVLGVQAQGNLTPEPANVIGCHRGWYDASRKGAFGRRSGDRMRPGRRPLLARMRRREFIGLVGGAAGLAGRGASAAIKTHPGRRCISGLKVAVSAAPNFFAFRFRGRLAGWASNLMLVGCYFC